MRTKSATAWFAAMALLLGTVSPTHANEPASHANERGPGGAHAGRNEGARDAKQDAQDAKTHDGVTADRVVQLAPQNAARIRIEAGYFTMGLSSSARAELLRACAGSPQSAGCDPELLPEERPRRRVYLGAFEIDRTEVSNADYLRCVAVSACAPARRDERAEGLARPEQPVTHVSFEEAMQYCRFRSGALPTESQWERAATGGSTRSFPWGHHWDPRLANHAEHTTRGEAVAVDAHPSARSFHGLLNQAGNVWEWVDDDPGLEQGASPAGVTAFRVLRGGAFTSPAALLRVSARMRLPVHERRADVGFRCAYEAAPAARAPSE